MALLTTIRAQRCGGGPLGPLLCIAQKPGHGWRIRPWSDQDFYAMGNLSGIYLLAAASSLDGPQTSSVAPPRASPLVWRYIGPYPCCRILRPRSRRSTNEVGE